jgi:hypothetical protein
MEGQLLWFLMAGFLLGFACSTLWEWFYYRGLRRRNLTAQVEVASIDTAVPAVAANEQPMVESSYRSPAIFIEGEEQNLEQPPGDQPTYEPVAEPRVAATDPVSVAVAEVAPPAESTGV